VLTFLVQETRALFFGSIIAKDDIKHHVTFNEEGIFVGFKRRIVEIKSLSLLVSINV
jgi:hypothetical protein